MFKIKKILKIKKQNYGFTLIELLVVVAIIGILSSVVLASLNSAREKAKISQIKTNLKNIIAEAEISFSDDGSYTSICTNSTGACAGKITKFCDAISQTGATVRCFTYLPSGVNYNSWSVSAKLADDKIYTVDPNGVYTFENSDITYSGLPTMSWQNATNTCSSTGKRLPSLEMMSSLWKITQTNPTPGFIAGDYWTSVVSPASSSNAYASQTSNGNVFVGNKGNAYRARCVY